MHFPGGVSGCQAGLGVRKNRATLENDGDFLQFVHLIQKSIFTGKEWTCFKYVCISLLIYAGGRVPG